MNKKLKDDVSSIKRVIETYSINYSKSPNKTTLDKLVLLKRKLHLMTKKEPLDDFNIYTDSFIPPLNNKNRIIWGRKL